MAFTFGAKRVVFRRDVEFTEGVEEGRLEGKEMKGKYCQGIQRAKNHSSWQSFENTYLANVWHTNDSHSNVVGRSSKQRDSPIVFGFSFLFRWHLICGWSAGVFDVKRG